MIRFTKTDPAYYLKHQYATQGTGKVLAEKLASKMLQLECNDPNLWVRFDPRVRAEDGGRFCVYEYIEEQFTEAQKASGRKPKKGLQRIYIIEDPDGGFTMPDVWVAKHLKKMREMGDELRSSGEMPSGILNPFK